MAILERNVSILRTELRENRSLWSLHRESKHCNMIKHTTILKHLLPTKRKLNTKQTHFTSPPSLSPLSTLSYSFLLSILFFYNHTTTTTVPPNIHEITETLSSQTATGTLPLHSSFLPSSTFTPRDNEKTALAAESVLLVTHFLSHAHNFNKTNKALVHSLRQS